MNNDGLCVLLVTKLAFVEAMGKMRGKKRKLHIAPVICSVSVLILLLFLTPSQIVKIFSDPVPLSAGEYNTQGIAVFNGVVTDEKTYSRITIKVDYSLVGKGLVKIDADSPDDESIFISLLPVNNDTVIDAEGRYDHKLKIYSENGVYSLTYGSGEYELCVWIKEDQTDDKYVKIYQNIFRANFPENEPYKYSNVYSEYESDSLASAYAHSVIKGDKSDMEKANDIIAFVHKKIEYDYAAENEMQLMTADEILESGKGICYSYTSLASAMLKSVGIPTREIRGYNKKSSAVHSWCEVLIDDEWLTADPAWYGYFPVNPDDYTPADYANPYA